MSIYRTNNSAEYFDVDQIVIDDTAPPGSISGVGTGIAIIAGQFERGPVGVLTRITSPTFLREMFGKNTAFSGYAALLNKKFSILKVVRVADDSAVKALKVFKASAVDIITFTAKYFGDYGNGIKVTIEAGSSSGSKYTVEDTNESAQYPVEVYDNIVITAVDSLTFAASNLIDVSVDATSAEPDAIVATALATGDDGTVDDADYETAITVTEQEKSGNILFLDAYNEVRNGYLKTSIGTVKDKMAILSTETVSVDLATGITNVGSMRDTAGALIYTSNWVETTIDAVKQWVSPASFYASLLSQTHPKYDPAYAGNTGYLYGISDIYNKRTRDEYVQAMEAGISDFEFDSDIGFKVKSGVVTQIADSSKIMVHRRRMTDYLVDSVAVYLKLYQNNINALENRLAVKAAMLNFIKLEEFLKNLPKDSEVSGGYAKVVDIETLNTDQTLGEGKFFIKYKQRIYSSMRFIIIMAEIGETVVVTEDEQV